MKDRQGNREPGSDLGSGDKGLAGMFRFNFHNRRGISFHAYALAGRPASRACLRLPERDAR